MTILHASTDPDLLTRLREMLDSAARADIAVGYFFVSGFAQVADKISRLRKTRILVGRTDQPTLEAVAAGLYQARPLQAKLDADRIISRSQRRNIAGHASSGIAENVAALPQTDETQNAVEQMRQLVASGLMEIRAYPREFLHAKAYLCWYEGHAEPGAAIVGSSNFTLAGFTGNTELNVRITGDADMAELSRWFEALWADSVDISDQVTRVLNESWAVKQYPPYLVYLKALYELYGKELDSGEPLPLEPTRHEDLANFQLDAVRRGLDMVRNHGGCYIADVVGLGKSFIGAELLRQLRQSYPNDGLPLIVCPAGLVPMWERFSERYGLGAAVLSQSRIAAPPQLVFDPETADYEEAYASQQGILLTEEYPHRGPVLVDEAHGFRNDNQRSRGLRNYLERGDHKVILLSATPQNLGPRDIYRQISLFMDERDHGLPIEPLALEDYFASAARWQEYREDADAYAQELAAYLKNGGEGSRPVEPARPDTPPADIAEVLTPIFIRRRRKDITELYGDTAMIDSEPISFPEPRLENLEYRLDQVYTKAGDFTDLLQTLGQYKAVRYSPTDYLKREYHDSQKYAGLFRARGRITGMIRHLLLKRMESSIAAFRSTLESLLNSNQNFRTALDAGYVPVGSVATRLLAGQNFDPQEALDILGQEETRHRRQHTFDADDFDVERWTEDLDNDYSILWDLADRVSDISPADDDKLETLKAFLKRPQVAGEKLLIFSEAETTVDYLHRELNPGGEDRTIDHLSGSRRDVAAGIIRRFAPNANPGGSQPTRGPEIRVLIATDVVSEGQNLQDCARVLNYDLHWNPVRLIQRFGRVDRIGSPYDEIHLHNMLPDMELDETLGLTDRLGDRIQAMHDIIGLDNKVLSQSERLNPTGIGKIYDDRTLPELDDEFDELTVNQRAISLLQRIRDTEPDLWKTIIELPDGIRSALTIQGNSAPGADQPRAGESIVMMATTDTVRCYSVGDDLAPRPIRSAQFVSAAECPPGMQPQPLPRTTNRRVNAASELFQQDLSRILGSNRRRTAGNLRNRQFIRRQLNGVPEEIATPQRVDTLRRVFTEDLPTVVENEISELRRLNLGGRELVLRLELLQERYRLNPADRSDEGTIQHQTTRIVCSDGLL